jgi:gamma-glutamylcyclotransferase (GGCT)/AIG2-like uncharacterized protein YtfP
LAGTEVEAGDSIALYGTLMRDLGGMQKAGLSRGLHYVGPCELEGQLFDLGAYPGLRPGPGRVVGELHRLVDPGVLTLLDEFEGFDPARPEDSLYLRQRIVLRRPAAAEAWVYVYNHLPEPGLRIESGDWRAHVARNRSPAR